MVEPDRSIARWVRGNGQRPFTPILMVRRALHTCTDCGQSSTHVVVGVGTALADDPQLTVRHVAGRNPARVVIDPARLPAAAKISCARRRPMFGNDSTQRRRSSQPIFQRRIAPEAILSALHERGLRRILIEGGTETLPLPMTYRSTVMTRKREQFH